MAAQLPIFVSNWFGAVALPVALALPLARRRPVQILNLDRGKKDDDNYALRGNMSEPPRTCRLCDGCGMLPCTVCNGKESPRRGGISPRNMAGVASLVRNEMDEHERY